MLEPLYFHELEQAVLRRQKEYPRVILDLCSGLGGWTEAFMDDPLYRVVRIENNPLLAHVPNTHMIDLMQEEHGMDRSPITQLLFDLCGGKLPYLILASPPCTEFSDGFHAPIPTARREGREFIPSTELVERCMDIICAMRPEHYVLENVRGSREWISPVIGGEPDQRVGPFYLWTSSHFPFLIQGGWISPKFKHTKEVTAWSSDPLRANKRGKIPLEISKAVKDAITAPPESLITFWMKDMAEWV